MEYGENRKQNEIQCATFVARFICKFSSFGCRFYPKIVQALWADTQ